MTHSITLRELSSVLHAAGLLRQDTATPELQLRSIAHDTRDVTPGALSVCIRGAKVDGHALLPDAVSRGAVAAIVEDTSLVAPGVAVPLLSVTDSRAALAVAADAFFGSPSKELQMIAVTGTN